MCLVEKQQVPANICKDVSQYGKFACDIKPKKLEPNRTRHTIGGDKIKYPFNYGTLKVDLLLVIIILNSVISTTDARF